MRKTNLIKVITILLMSVMVMLFTTTVRAVDSDDGFNDLTSEISSNTNTNNTNTNSTNTNNTNTNSANTNSTNKNTNNTNKNNTSVYSNTDLPKTGIEDSIPVAMLVVVFGISAVYAYKKIKEYKNI